MSDQTSEIKLQVGLDEQSIPATIHWTADQQSPQPQECKAFLLSLFEKDSKETLKIDLWTKDMQIQEMDRFFYHTLKSMSQTYLQATNNQALSDDMMDFVEHFGKKIGFLPE